MPLRRDLWSILLYTASAVLVLLLDAHSTVAAIYLCPLVLFAPGYGLTCALDSSAAPFGIGRRLVLAVALSLATCVLGGLLLNATTELNRLTWSLWLSAVTVAGCAVALRRRPAGPGRPDAEPVIRRRAPNSVLVKSGLTLGAISAMLAAAIILALDSAKHAYDKPLTQLALVQAAGHPTSPRRIEVTNRSGRAQLYTLTVSLVPEPPGSDLSTPAPHHPERQARDHDADDRTGVIERRLLRVPASVTWSEAAPTVSSPSQSELSAVITPTGSPANRLLGRPVPGPGSEQVTWHG